MPKSNIIQPQLNTVFHDAVLKGEIDHFQKRCQIYQLPLHDALTYSLPNGETPLHWCMLKKNIDLLVWFVFECPYHLNFNVKTVLNETPVHYLSYSKWLEGLIFLSELGIYSSELAHHFVKTRWHQGLLCLNKYFPHLLIEEDKNDETPLMVAASLGHLDTIDLLIKYGNINPKQMNKSGWTAIHIAAREGQFIVANYLNTFYNLPYTQSPSFKTSPLEVALHFNQHEFIRQFKIKKQSYYGNKNLKSPLYANQNSQNNDKFLKP